MASRITGSLDNADQGSARAIRHLHARRARAWAVGPIHRREHRRYPRQDVVGFIQRHETHEAYLDRSFHGCRNGDAAGRRISGPAPSDSHARSFACSPADRIQPARVVTPGERGKCYAAARRPGSLVMFGQPLRRWSHRTTIHSMSWSPRVSAGSTSGNWWIADTGRCRRSSIMAHTQTSDASDTRARWRSGIPGQDYRAGPHPEGRCTARSPSSQPQSRKRGEERNADPHRRSGTQSASRPTSAYGEAADRVSEQALGSHLSLEALHVSAIAAAPAVPAGSGFAAQCARRCFHVVPAQCRSPR